MITREPSRDRTGTSSRHGVAACRHMSPSYSPMQGHHACGSPLAAGTTLAPRYSGTATGGSIDSTAAGSSSSFSCSAAAGDSSNSSLSDTAGGSSSHSCADAIAGSSPLLSSQTGALHFSQALYNKAKAIYNHNSHSYNKMI